MISWIELYCVGIGLDSCWIVLFVISLFSLLAVLLLKTKKEITIKNTRKENVIFGSRHEV